MKRLMQVVLLLALTLGVQIAPHGIDWLSGYEAQAAVVTPQIAAGNYHSLALKNDGMVVTWGNNFLGQLGDGTTVNKPSPTPVPGLTGIIAVAAGNYHNMALKNDGTVVAWGENNYGQLGDGITGHKTSPTPVPGLTGIIAVAAGYGHSVALKNDGTVVAWGRNDYGQLGDGTAVIKLSPTPVPGLAGVIAIAAGYNHSVALKNDGTVVAWGYNSNGQLGDGTVIDKTNPTLVPGLTGVIAIAAGYEHSMALKNDGTVVAWGYNSNGQLGDGTVIDKTNPTLVPGLTGVIAVAAGYEHSMALKNDGTVVACGWNNFGQLGDGSLVDKTSPTPVPGLAGVTAITAGYSHSVALKNDGTVIAWGGNLDGQLGDGTTGTKSSPIPVPGLTGVIAVAAGYEHSMALKNDGTVVAWGFNYYGQLGDGTTVNKYSPTPVLGLTGIIAIAAAYYNGVALKNDGTVVTWGNNSAGQLGDGTKVNKYSPTPVPGLTGVTAIAAGNYHNVALENDGTVVAWGGNTNGQLGDGTTGTKSSPTPVPGLTGIIAIAAGYGHSVALKNDGTVVAWGNNSAGQLGDGTTMNKLSPTPVPGLTGVIAIAAGNYHNVALKNDGTVVAWGRNNYGQLGDGTILDNQSPTPVPGLTGVIAIAAGYNHSVALKNDGMIVAWGHNNMGQLGDGTIVDKQSPTPVPGLTSVTAIAAGGSHSVALNNDGTVVAWGFNLYGQLGVLDGSMFPHPAMTNLDTLPPLTATDLPGGIYIGSQSINLSCNDNFTGCNRTWYTTDNSDPTWPLSGTTQAYSDAITISNTATLKYFSRDNAGNSESIQSKSYTIATSSYPLTITLIGSGTVDGLTTGAPATVSFSANGSTIISGGAVVTLTATPGSGYCFISWSGCDSTSGNQCTVLMDSVKSVTAIFNAECGAGPCPDLVASGMQMNWNSTSINSLGEVVWNNYDQSSGKYQLFSSLRGQLTFDAVDHSSPAINNLGDLVWLESDGIKGVIGGQPVTVLANYANIFINKVDINDHGEVVWDQADFIGGNGQIYSNLRGQLTNDAGNHFDPSINNQGEITFINANQIYRLSAGSSVPALVTSNTFFHLAPAINDSGEIAWIERDMSIPGSATRLVSSSRGTLFTTAAFAYALDLNSCGDIAYTADNGVGQINLYRLGGYAPCMTLPGALFPLAIGKDPTSTGTGRIESAPVGISLSSMENFTTATFPAGTQVILSATADGNSAFAGWSGACTGTDTCTLSMTTARSVTATFMLKVAALCGSDNGKTLTSTPTNLCAPGIASAVTGSGPWNWTCSGSYGGSDAVCAASLQTYAVTFASGGNGTLAGATNQVVNHGGNTTEVTANAAADYHFVNWTDANGVVLAANNPVTINSVTSVMTVTANFAHNPVDGVCGSTNTGIFRAAPAGSFCSPDAVVSLTPTDTGWTWTCPGSYGGSNASCSAARDVTAPELLVSTLANGAATNNNTLNISGSVTDANSLTLTINNTPITVNSDHSYSHAITLVDGDNQITVIATDVAGNGATDQRTIKYDAAAPKLTITAPADNSKTAQVLATISGTVDETATVVVKSVLDGSQTATMDGNGFSATVNLEQGLNTIDIIATDLAGNSSSAKRTVTYDPLKPTLGITSPASDMTVYTDRATISGTAGDTISGIADLVISVDGKEYRPTVTNGSFSQEVTFSGEQLYPVTVTATDTAGNSESVTRNIIFSKGLIAINGYAATTATTAVKLSLGYYPSAAKMQFLANNVSWTAWEAFAQTKNITLPGGDGLKTVYVRFLDGSGNSSQIYSTAITLDSKAPTGSITINNGAAVTTISSVSLSLAVTDSTDGITMQLSNSSSFAGAVWEPYVASKSFNLTDSYGTRTVYARFKDTGGKVSAVTSDTILYQQAAPATGDSGALIINGGAQYTILPGVQLTITRPDASHTQMSLSNNGVTWSGWTAIPAAAKAYTLPAGDGVKTVYVKFRTAALAESATYADTIVLDSKPPVGTITINAGAFVTNNRHVTLSLTAADLNGVSDMQFSTNGSTWSGWELFAVSKEIDLLPGDGVRKVYVRYRDSAGKVSPAYYDTINVDTKAPVGTVKINAGAATTANPLVTLNVAASGVPVAFQFSLDNGVSWSDWEPYAKVRKVTLPGGSGARSVLVKLKDLAGNVSGSIGDTILLAP